MVKIDMNNEIIERLCDILKSLASGIGNEYTYEEIQILEDYLKKLNNNN